MASVNFAKFKTAGECKAMMRHCDAAERVAGEHSNPDIDKALTASNGAIKGLGYSDVCAAYDHRIAALDAAEGANKRKDRVTLLGLDVPRPAGLMDADQDAWFRRVWDITAQMYGADNMLEGYIHRDEVHAYTDPTTKREVTSREHMHMYVIPERNGRLCAKECTSRASMIALNNEIQAMTAKEFGVQFMDGSKRKSRGTVEEMKAQSVIAEAERQAAEILRTAETQAAKLTLRESRIERKEREQQAKATEFQRREDALEAQVRALHDREQALDARELAVDTREKEQAQALRVGRAAIASTKFDSIRHESTEKDGMRHPERRTPDIDF